MSNPATRFRSMPTLIRFLACALCLAGAAALPAADGEWVLRQSAITYHVSHPLHNSEGISRAAKGKGVCHAGTCQFLIAAPVASFDSGDTNRDLHMQQVTRAAVFPLVTVRTQLPQDLPGATFRADLEVQFAGESVTYRQVTLKLAHQGDDVHITGTVPATLSDFKIDPPKLLTIAVRNEMPVDVDLTWRFTEQP